VYFTGLLPPIVPLAENIPFDDVSAASPDILFNGVNDTLIFQTAGTYAVHYSVTVATPGQTSLTVNQAPVSGSTFAAPVGTALIIGQATITVHPGDSLALINAGPNPLTVAATAPDATASMLVEKVG
jgi:hypothetical protein